MTDNEKKEIILALRQLLAMCPFTDQYGDSIDAEQYFDAVETAIESMNKTRWIPVSEKPKDEKKTYLVQLDSGGIISCRWTNVNQIWTDLTTDWHWHIMDIPQHCRVVAWMDLEPYKEDDGEE